MVLFLYANKFMKKILLATRNKTKLNLYKDVFFGLANIFSPQDISGEKITVEETLDNASLNAKMKAEAYLGIGDYVILGEDTLLEIPILDNKPGPGIRRWGGELSDDVSDKEWLSFFSNKLREVSKGSPVPCVKRYFYYFINRSGKGISFSLSFPYVIVLRDIPDGMDFADGPLSHLLQTPDGTYECDLTQSQKAELFSKLRDFAETNVLN